MTTVYLSLGSNMGDRQGYLDRALAALNQLPQTTVDKVSSYYETAAWGKRDQADFLNICCQLGTKLSPQELLCHCQKIEKDLERVRREHWGPRTIDIDLLFYGQQSIKEDNLKVPHPYMFERAFVLVPLLEIAPKLAWQKQELKSYLEKLETKDIKKVIF